MQLYNKKFLVIYISICIMAMVLCVTGYSFSIDFLNYVLVAILLLYPVIRFIISPAQLWIKIAMVILMATPVLLFQKEIRFFLAFRSETKTKLEEWTVEDYKIVLSQRQGWAGPPYERFDLIKYNAFGLIKKTVAYGYREANCPEAVPCTIIFESAGSNKNQTYEFDRCMKNLKKM